MELTQFKSKCSINQFFAPEFIVALSIGNKSILYFDLLVCCPIISFGSTLIWMPKPRIPQKKSNLIWLIAPILGERLSSSWRRPRCLGRRGLRAILLWSELWKRGLGKRLPPTSVLLHGTHLACTSHGTLCVARIMPRLPPKNYSEQCACNPVGNAVFQCTLQLHHLVKQLHLASCPVPTYWSLDRIKF